MKSLIDSIPENRVANLWQSGLLSGVPLVSEDGKQVEIIYPGRRNDDRGADFRDAVILIDREILKGDVEIHVRSSGWTEHGHHRDTEYNTVILHVTVYHNAKIHTVLQNGKIVPVLALEKHQDILADLRSGEEFSARKINMPCYGCFRRQDGDTLLKFVNRSGEERFVMKAELFQGDIIRLGPGQSLYRGIMGALGYSKNKQPCMELARRLPLKILESADGNKISDEDYLVNRQALLLGTAGLLPTSDEKWNQDGRSVNRRREKTWWIQSLPPQIRPMSADKWCMFKVRPNNSPVRRLVAVSYLMLRYREKGLLDGLLGLVGDVSLSRGHRELEKGLRVNFLGSGRAADIAINVLLPFTFAWSRHTSTPEIGERALYLFRNYPGTEFNSIERHLSEQLGLDRDHVNSAARQQGLIHIYKNLCTQGRCTNCELGKL
ncbi:DUF2851 family protein [Chloroflexota bacterium]